METEWNGLNLLLFLLGTVWHGCHQCLPSFIFSVCSFHQKFHNRETFSAHQVFVIDYLRSEASYLMEADRIEESIVTCIVDHIHNELNNIVHWISVFKLTKATARLSLGDYSDRNKKMQVCKDKMFTYNLVHHGCVMKKKEKNTLGEIKWAVLAIRSGNLYL